MDTLLRKAVLIIVAAALLWQFSGVLLLAFAAVLVAILLLAITGMFRKILPVGQGGALALSCLTIALVAAGFFYLLGAQIVVEANQLGKELPELLQQIGRRIGVADLDQRLLRWGQNFMQGDGLMGRITATTSFLVAGLADAVLILVAGVYLAASPKTYRHGMLRLVPLRWRSRTAQFTATVGRALKLWLAAQLATMIAVGVLFTIGLMILGVPSAMALGFIAGVAEFVPFAGPILGAVPALLIALPLGLDTVFGVFVLYLAIQTLEGNVIQPLLTRRAVDLPPVLTLFGIVAMAGSFGSIGLLLASPLAVTAFIAVKQFYLRDALKQQTSIPGERDP